jgi:hypothetical protein
MQQKRLEELSLQNPLTKTANRRCLQKISLSEIARTNRHRTPLSLTIFDIDHFKVKRGQPPIPVKSGPQRQDPAWISGKFRLTTYPREDEVFPLLQGL